MDSFIQNIPKAELHVHIEGTLEPELMFKLAERNKVTLPFKRIAEVKNAYQFQNLQSFLDVFYQSSKVLLQQQDFYDLTWAYLQKARQQNIRHAEIFFDPQTHTHRGIEFKIFLPGIRQAIIDAKQTGISAKLIMCFLRDLSEEDAIKTFQQALPYKEGIVAIGLDSAEKNNPPVKFKKVYEMARKEGFLAVAHAGEESSPEYIWQALDILKVSRIDHGVRCFEDTKLVQRLHEDKITLTVCPLSNLKLKVFNNLRQHPLKKMLEVGLQATINSDDPAFFSGYVNENISAAQTALHLTKQDIYQLEKNAFQGSFITSDEKMSYLIELDKFYQSNTCKLS
jgi:adenosine deaminase